ncbi:hypothetical protein GQ600_5677 [Phytophthora cactorum]|nr:hypothetical protein GQ600_5677 [Phytophthora cactorum]
MTSGIFRHGTASENMKIPCRHIQAVIIYLDRKIRAAIPLLPGHGILSPSIHGHHYSRWFGADVINLPNDSVGTCEIMSKSAGPLRVTVIPQMILLFLPPPIYRQAGGVRNANGSDVKRGKNEHQYDEDDSAEIDSFFGARVSAEQKSHRSAYHCSKCGSVEHNAAICLNNGREKEDKGNPISPRIYVLGSCPLTPCLVGEDN